MTSGLDMMKMGGRNALALQNAKRSKRDKVRINGIAGPAMRSHRAPSRRYREARLPFPTDHRIHPQADAAAQATATIAPCTASSRTEAGERCTTRENLEERKAEDETLLRLQTTEESGDAISC
jgi:hypothetical protein